LWVNQLLGSENVRFAAVMMIQITDELCGLIPDSEESARRERSRTWPSLEALTGRYRTSNQGIPLERGPMAEMQCTSVPLLVDQWLQAPNSVLGTFLES
jgi:hypothetical protein